MKILERCQYSQFLVICVPFYPNIQKPRVSSLTFFSCYCLLMPTVKRFLPLLNFYRIVLGSFLDNLAVNLSGCMYVTDDFLQKYNVLRAMPLHFVANL